MKNFWGKEFQKLYLRCPYLVLALAVHAAIANILHLSAAGRYIDEILDEFEEKSARNDRSTHLGHLVQLKIDGWPVSPGS